MTPCQCGSREFIVRAELMEPVKLVKGSLVPQGTSDIGAVLSLTCVKCEAAQPLPHPDDIEWWF